MAVWLYVLGWIFRKKLHLPFRETKNFLSVFFVRHFCYADISTLRPSNRYLLCFCLLTYSALVAHNLICVLCYWRIIGFCVCALFYVDLLTHARSTKGVKGFLVELGKKNALEPRERHRSSEHSLQILRVPGFTNPVHGPWSLLP